MKAFQMYKFVMHLFILNSDSSKAEAGKDNVY